MKKRFFNSKIINTNTLSVAAVVCLIVVIAGLFFQIFRGDTRQRISIASNQINAELLGLQDCYYAFLASQQPVALSQIDLRKARLDSSIGTLTPLVARNPAEQEQLAALKKTVTQWCSTAKASTKATSQQPLTTIQAAIQNFQASSTYQSQNLLDVTLPKKIVLYGAGLVSLLSIFTLRRAQSQYRVQLRKNGQLLSTAKTRHQNIIEATSEAYFITNRIGTIESMNGAAGKLFGVDEKKMIGQNIAKLIPDQSFINGLTNGEIFENFATTGLRNHFVNFPLEIVVGRPESSDHSLKYLVVRDITESKNSNDTLRDISLSLVPAAANDEEFLRTLIRGLASTLQTDFAFIAQISRKTGAAQRCSILLVDNGNIFSIPERPIELTLCAKTIQSGSCTVPENARELFPHDKLIQDLRAESGVASALINHDGEQIGVIGVLHRTAISDLKNAETVLQIFAARAGVEIERQHFDSDLNSEKERLSIILRSIREGFITIDSNGNVILVNSVAEDLTGWKQADAIGKSLHDVLQLHDEFTRVKNDNALNRIIEMGTIVGLNPQYILPDSHGEERLIELSVSPLRDDTNLRVGTVIIFRDITQKRRFEVEQVKTEKLKSLSDVAGGIAHDFNNLLTAILGNLSLALALAPRDAPFIERMTAAKKASLRAQELSQQLLTFAKSGAPILKLITLTQLLRDTVYFSLHDPRIKAQIEIPDDLWPVLADGGQISQVVSNLIINAEQAMPNGGKIRFTAENIELTSGEATPLALRPYSYVKISVQDNGVGISPENIKKIFDPYFTTKPKGNGLGLATCYSIIKNHEGVIAVESARNNGTTFTIYLPKGKQAPIAIPQPKQPELPGNVKNDILILDPDNSITTLVSAALKPIGYSVTETQSTAQMVSEYEKAWQMKQPYKLVIIDLSRSDDPDRKDAIKHLLTINPNCRAIATSNDAEDACIKNHTDFGFSAAMPKPYEISVLYSTIDNLIPCPNGSNGANSVNRAKDTSPSSLTTRLSQDSNSAR